MTFVTVRDYKKSTKDTPPKGRLSAVAVSENTYSDTISARGSLKKIPNEVRQTWGTGMCFLSRLAPALGNLLRTGAGSSKYEHALLCSLAAIVCILAFIVLV